MTELAAGAVDRRAFVAQLIRACPQALIVSGLGSSSYDVFAAGDRAENFYLWGAMGGAAALGLGLALARPRRLVVVVTGDGEQLMGMGALATIAAQKPANLVVVVLDNGHFGETGMQRSHTSHGANLAKIAEGCGFAWCVQVTKMDEIAALAVRIGAMQGCGFAQVFVRAEKLPRSLPPRDGIFVKNRFRAALGFVPL